MNSTCEGIVKSSTGGKEDIQRLLVGKRTGDINTEVHNHLCTWPAFSIGERKLKDKK